MCVRAMLLKPSKPNSLYASFVPCGKCEECRDSSKAQWTFRLRSELDYCRSKGWHIGFFTLSYNNAHLPHLPKCIFNKPEEYRKISCFSRYDVRTFIDNIRKRVHEKFGVKSLRYMICAEYGKSENTHRPHYHGLICFPPEVPPNDMFELIKKNWCDKGFIMPRYITGGVDSHGSDHKPFLIQGDTEGAACYAAKYCCKDIEWYDSIKRLDLDEEHPLFKRSKSFHIQSQGIGRSWLCGKSTKELVVLFRKGDGFLGQLKTKALPLYIRNKVLYNPKYVFDEYRGDCGDERKHDWSFDYNIGKYVYTPGIGTHVRLVRREATKFFREHYQEVYRQKKEYYQELFSQMNDVTFWTNRGCPLKQAVDISNVLLRSSFSSSTLADYFLAYYGVKLSERLNCDPATAWFSRYGEVGFVGLDEFTEEQMTVQRGAHELVNYLLDRFQWLYSYDLQQRKKTQRIKDFYSHLT